MNDKCHQTAVIVSSVSSFQTDLGEIRVEVNPRTAEVIVSGPGLTKTTFKPCLEEHRCCCPTSKCDSSDDPSFF